LDRALWCEGKRTKGGCDYENVWQTLFLSAQHPKKGGKTLQQKRVTSRALSA